MEIFRSAGSNNQRRKILVFLAGVLFFAFSCKKGTVIPPPETGVDYIPVASGKYIIYDVDSIHFDDFTKKSDTFSFQLKEEMGESFTDLQGNASYQLKRYTRIDTGNVNELPWTLKNVWYVTKLTERYERVEESFRYSRLKFPITEGGVWNGNAFNTEDEWDYTYVDVFKPYILESDKWDSTVTVIEIDEELLISKKYYKEVYAKNIGLVYRYFIDVASQDLTPPIKPIMDRIEKGVIYDQRYVTHGTN